MAARWSALVLIASAIACTGDTTGSAPEKRAAAEWQAVLEGTPGALMRAAGLSDSSVFVVGADVDGRGPLVYHVTEAGNERIDLGQHGSLWWFQQTADDTLHMVGDSGLVVSYDLSTREVSRIATPVRDRIFGVWSAHAGDIWYVGGDLEQNTGFVLRGDGNEIRLPDGLETPLPGAMFKVTGFGRDSVWMVGQRGNLLHCQASRFEQNTLDTPLSLLALSGTSEQALYAVGGAANGVILHRSGKDWSDETPAGLPPMNAVWAVDEELAYAAGFNGHLYVRQDGVWQEFEPAPPTFQDLHSVWVDDEGGIWLAGGRMTTDPPTDGVLLYYGPKHWKTEAR
ncbi:MAG TPA: hypothetical protein VJR89_34005 [Polyangiales bacterium]|nr:hypothetical protein [Polyangiales bacterium]